jgi:prephenate dehydrogenase
MMAERPVASVLGLGKVGASLALCLRRTGRYASVAGWDPDFDVARSAKKAATADRFASNAPAAVRDAAVVFIALTGEAFQETLLAMASHLRSGAVVCSLLEAHEVALEQAPKTLPGNVSFVCADPVVWQASTGAAEETAREAFFRDGIWCISSTATAHQDAVGYVARIGEELGMVPFFVDAREHDAFAAGLRSLPLILAAALMRVASRQPAWREMSRLAGTAFREATAPVAEDPDVLLQEMGSAPEHLVRWIDLYVAELTVLRESLKDSQKTSAFFESAWEARLRWLKEREVPAQARELPSVQIPRRRFPF